MYNVEDLVWMTLFGVVIGILLSIGGFLTVVSSNNKNCAQEYNVYKCVQGEWVPAE